MNHSANAITFFEGFGHFAANFLNDTSIVASDSRASVGNFKVDMLPVCGVDTNSIDFNKHIVVTELGLWDFLDSGLALLDHNDGFGSHVGGFV